MAERPPRKRGRPNIYSSHEVKSKAKANRKRARQSSITLMHAHSRWLQLKSVGGWTHSELALHLMDIHERFCGPCSAKHARPTSNPNVDLGSTATSSNEAIPTPETPPQTVSPKIVLVASKVVPAPKSYYRKILPSLPANVQSSSNISSQMLSNGNNATAGAIAVPPIKLKLPIIKSLDSGKSGTNVVILPRDVESNRLEVNEEPERNDDEDTCDNVGGAISDEESDEEDAALIIVGTLGDGDEEDEEEEEEEGGFVTPISPLTTT